MTENTAPIEGPPWNNHRRFSTFEEASAYRYNLLVETEELQVKVRWSRQRDDFVVKTRTDPEVVAKQKETKKKRTKKKSKK